MRRRSIHGTSTLLGLLYKPWTTTTTTTMMRRRRGW
jgi:hypothetical protein